MRGGRQPGRDAAQRAPVGLVGAERGVVPRVVGEGVQLPGRRDQPVGHRQLAAQRLQLPEVVPDRRRGLPVGGPAQRVGGDERVAVAVAADPGPRQQHRPGQQPGVGPALVESLPELGVDGRDDVEQRQLVVAQRLVDLVRQAQPGQPQQRRLPERQHRAPQLPRPLLVVALAGRGPVPLADQVGDLPLRPGRSSCAAPRSGARSPPGRPGPRPAPGRRRRRPGRRRRSPGRRPRGCPSAAASPRAGGSAAGVRGGCPRPGWPAARSG